MIHFLQLFCFLSNVGWSSCSMEMLENFFWTRNDQNVFFPLLWPPKGIVTCSQTTPLAGSNYEVLWSHRSRSLPGLPGCWRVWRPMWEQAALTQGAGDTSKHLSMTPEDCLFFLSRWKYPFCPKKHFNICCDHHFKSLRFHDPPPQVTSTAVCDYSISSCCLAPRRSAGDIFAHFLHWITLKLDILLYTAISLVIQLCKIILVIMPDLLQRK